MLFPPGAAFGPRFQTGFEVIAVLSGGLVIEIDGPALDLAGGRGLPAAPRGRCLFRFDPGGESQVRYVVSYEPALPRPMLDGLEGRPFSLPLSAAMGGMLEAVLALSGPVPAGRSVTPRSAAAPVWLAAACSPSSSTRPAPGDASRPGRSRRSTRRSRRPGRPCAGG